MTGKTHSSFLPEHIDLFRKQNIFHTNAASVMGSEGDSDLVVHVAPLRMVIHGVGDLCDPFHERERLREILEGELSNEFVLLDTPLWEFSKFFLESGLGECVYHRTLKRVRQYMNVWLTRNRKHQKEVLRRSRI